MRHLKFLDSCVVACFAFFYLCETIRFALCVPQFKGRESKTTLSIPSPTSSSSLQAHGFFVVIHLQKNKKPKPQSTRKYQDFTKLQCNDNWFELAIPTKQLNLHLGIHFACTTLSMIIFNENNRFSHRNCVFICGFMRFVFLVCASCVLKFRCLFIMKQFSPHIHTTLDDFCPLLSTLKSKLLLLGKKNFDLSKLDSGQISRFMYRKFFGSSMNVWNHTTR